jgi:3-deoxy-D-manno-octulosonic-acid transferase
MMAANERGVRLGIVNGRMSDRSFRRWSRIPGFIGALLRPLAFCTAQSDGDAARYRALGAPAISPGNLKFDVPPLPFDAAARTLLDARIGDRPVLVAASTHAGEEEQIIAASRALAPAHPDLLTILVPRHPARGEEVARQLETAGERALRRSLGASPEPDAAFYIADTLGELGLFYGLATLALVGGSLIEHGGHNPIEPVRCGCPVVSGPHVANFRDIYADLVAAGGTELIPPGPGLAKAIGRWLADAKARDHLREAAMAALRRHEGALDRTVAILRPLLDADGTL